MKFLITFEKGEAVRWLGHLDILRTFERAIRRAELPIAFSTGFNPREKIAFASALAVGITGEAERATIELTESLPPEALIHRLNEKLPPGIRLTAAEEIPDAGSRDLLNSFTRAELRIVCACAPETTRESAQRAADNLIAASALPITREREGRVKQVDIRPFLHTVEVAETGAERVAFIVQIALGAEGSARSEEIVARLAADLPGLAVRRTHRVRLIQA